MIVGKVLSLKPFWLGMHRSSLKINNVSIEHVKENILVLLDFVGIGKFCSTS